MIITLKDGSTKEYSEPKSIIEIAADISEGLARMACAGEVNGEVEDLRTVIDKDCNLSILTFNDEGGKAAFRHTTSHIMAQAIKRLYPETKLARNEENCKRGSETGALRAAESRSHRFHERKRRAI